MSNGWWERKLNNPAPNTPPPATRPPDRVLPAMPTPQPASTPHIQVTADNFAEASTRWTGGDASRNETQNCPNCGSNLFFSRANGGSLVSGSGMAAPAPRCYECGYTPGREMQGAPPA